MLMLLWVFKPSPFRAWPLASFEGSLTIPPTPSTGTCGKPGLRVGKGWAGTHM